MNKFLIIIFLGIPVLLFGQNIKNTNEKEVRDFPISIIAKNNTKSILLRWIPSNYALWQDGIRNGYTLKRRTFEKNSFTKFTEKVIFVNKRPNDIEWWNTNSKNDKYIATAKGLVFTDEIYSVDIKNKQDSLDAESFAYYFAMHTSDMSNKVANAMALGFEDFDVKEGESYEYIISLENTKNFTDNESHVFVDMSVFIPEIVPNILEYKFKDSTAVLSIESGYSAYFIERSDDNGGVYKVVNKLPVIPTFDSDDNSTTSFKFSDHVPILYKNYLYRVKGVTPFSNYTKSSKPIKVFAFQTNLPTPDGFNYRVTSDTTISFKWSFPDSLVRNLKGFELLTFNSMGDVPKKVSKKIINKNVRSYVLFKPKRTAFYQIVGIDLNNNRLESIPLRVNLIDTIPPKKPTNIKGIISKNGIVKLSWDNNLEDDFYGYNIYHSDNAKTGYTLSNSLVFNDNSFVDTVALNMREKYIYYTVAALDDRLNVAYSIDTIKIPRPDIIPPISPLFDNWNVTDSSIYLHWKPSISNDVIAQILYKLDINSGKNDTILIDSTNQISFFLDTNITEKNTYKYVIAAKDGSNESSQETSYKEIKVYPPKYRAAITNFKGIFSSSNKRVEIKWDIPICKYSNLNKYLLFKENIFGEKELLTEINLKEIVSYFDNNIQPKSKMTYYITGIYEDNSQTTFSSFTVEID